MDTIVKYALGGSYVCDTTGLRGIHEGEVEFFSDGKLVGTVTDCDYGDRERSPPKIVLGLHLPEERKIIISKIAPFGSENLRLWVLSSPIIPRGFLDGIWDGIWCTPPTSLNYEGSLEECVAIFKKFSADELRD